MDKIAVLIPCYNEEKTIEKVVKDAKEALPEAVVYVIIGYIKPLIGIIEQYRLLLCSII